ncbi:MAG: hypothetical protein ACLUEK_01030 [Oscillospiraceae bacterium]
MPSKTYSTFPFMPQARLVTRPPEENLGSSPMFIITEEPVP